MLLTIPPSLKLPPTLKLRRTGWRTGKKQIAYIFTLCFIFACAQNIHAMRCNFKSLLTHKTSRFFCSKSEKSDDQKKLQQMYDSVRNVAPKGFLTDACINHDSCCLLAKNDAAQAKKGKAIRLKKMLTEDGSGSVYILRDIKLRMLILQEKNVEVQKIVAESQDKEAVEPLHENFRKLIKNASECLTYTANIHGKTFYEHSADYYAQHPDGIFNSTQHMTFCDRERETLQNECNKINKEIMKDNGYTLNKNILLGWGEHSSSDLVGARAGLKGIESKMPAYDQLRKDGGGVY
jgi:hypothetical protein